MRLLRFGLVAVTCCGALVLSGCPDKPAATPDAGVADAPQVPATPPPTRFSLSYQAPPDAAEPAGSGTAAPTDVIAAAANDAGAANPGTATPADAIAAAATDAGLVDSGTAAMDLGLTDIALAPDDAAIIEPTTLLELRTSRLLKNYRVRLFDEADRAMISDDEVEETEAGLVYRIRLPRPLKSGFKYTLVVDAQTGTAFTDALGRDVDEFRQTLQIAGEKDKPAPPPRRSGKRRR
ncbi:hypothetical protein [Corallococcus macrosporus]|uniref:hypothetical protein n=1 Tax=Corallococcus macrosporus TaxID=35 RepID=UPI000BB2EF68|nr:hypothetical protein [Corallococcus macrosporus]